MPSQGPRYPASTSTAAKPGGLKHWSNVSNLTADDAAYASHWAGDYEWNGQESHFAVGTNCGFSIPSGATIDGIVLEAEAYKSIQFPPKDIWFDYVQLVKGGSVAGSNKGSTASQLQSSLFVHSWGGSSDLWGTTWSVSDVNGTGFGGALGVETGYTSGFKNALVDYLRVTVYYTSSSVNLVVQDATHAHAAESAALTQTHSLSVADAAHAQAAESPALAQTHVLSAADATHAHTAKSAALIQTHSLTVADAAHAQATESPALAQTHVLSAADATHAHAAEQVSLSSGVMLTPQGTAHQHAADTPSLSQTHLVSGGRATHVHTAVTPLLNQIHKLVIAASRHAHAADQVLVSLPSALPGVEVRASRDRPHYRLAAERQHYRLALERLHYRASET